jgi:predicted RNA-binding Zn-ribbon protein involved in translation (DUF1610 family)
LALLGKCGTNTLAGVEIKCPKCGSELAGGEGGVPRFCPNCAAAALAEPSQSRSEKSPAAELGSLVIFCGIAICIATGIILAPAGPAALIAVLVVAAGYALGQSFGRAALSRIICGVLGGLGLLAVVIAIVFAGCMLVLKGHR